MSQVLMRRNGWPVGMPPCRAMGLGLLGHAHRLAEQSNCPRALAFGEGSLAGLYGFIKLTQKTLNNEFGIGAQTQKELKS